MDTILLFLFMALLVSSTTQFEGYSTPTYIPSLPTWTRPSTPWGTITPDERTSFKRFGLNCDPSTLFDYSGTINVTNKGIACKRWADVSESLFDDNDFPLDGSKVNASNYCRDPLRMRVLPWCMTVNSSISWDFCNYPICGGRVTAESMGGILVDRTGEFGSWHIESLPPRILWTLAAPPGHTLDYKILALRTSKGSCNSALDVFTSVHDGQSTYYANFGYPGSVHTGYLSGDSESNVVYVSFKTKCPNEGETGFKMSYTFIRTERRFVSDLFGDHIVGFPTRRPKSTTQLSSSDYTTIWPTMTTPTTFLPSTGMASYDFTADEALREGESGAQNQMFNVVLIFQLHAWIVACLRFIIQ